MASELAWPQPSGLPCLRSYAWTLQVISTKPENIDELKKVLQLIWDQLPQKDSINEAIVSFWLVWGHFEHTLKWTACQILVFVITVNVSWQWKLQVAVDYSGWASTSTISVLDVHVDPGGTAHLPPHVDPILKSIACMPADITGNWADKRDFMLDALPVATVRINQRFVLAPKYTSYTPVQCCGLNMLHILILHLPLVTSCH